MIRSAAIGTFLWVAAAIFSGCGGNSGPAKIDLGVEPACVQGGQCSAGDRCSPDNNFDCSWCDCTDGKYHCAAPTVDYCGGPPREGEACSACLGTRTCSHACDTEGGTTGSATFSCDKDLKWHVVQACSPSDAHP